jgi:hypothetical protein
MEPGSAARAGPVREGWKRKARLDGQRIEHRPLDNGLFFEAQLVDEVDFSDISPLPHLDSRSKWATDAGYLKRTRIVAELCEDIASLER